MTFILKQFKQLLIIQVFLLCAALAIAQGNTSSTPARTVTSKPVSGRLKRFNRLTSDAGMHFIFPEGFKEIPPLNNDDFTFNYAMTLPGRDFEIWFMVKSQKKAWQAFSMAKNDASKQNPDSAYNALGYEHAVAFTGDTSFLTRTIPKEILVRYNANAGKTYLLNLKDQGETKHYKYALLITLEKDHTSTLLVMCLGNENGTEFFKNISLASKCLKFK